MNLLWVALGSALGGLGRYGVSVAVRSSVGFPWATFLINIFGSLVIGVLSGWLASSSTGCGSMGAIRCFAIIGLCGGFTTFSTFSNETFRMLGNGQWALAVIYAVGSVVAGLAAVALGYALSR